MKKYILLLIFIGSFSNIWAQYSLSGTVVDTKTQETLPGVNIYSPQLKKGTITDMNGHFAFDHIPLKEIVLQFSYIGYKPVTKKIIFKTKHQQIKVPMQEAVFEMDEVIVSTGANKLQKDNVMKVVHKSAAAMNRKGIQNIMEGIAQIPGVSNLSTGTGIAKPVIRGLSGNRVLVYNQGVRLENYQFGEKHGMGIDAAGIAGVEVIKGPASLLYGSDALGGVIYLIPEKYAPKNSHAYNFSSRFFTNTQGIHNSLGVKASGKYWQYLIRQTYKLNGDYQIPSGQRVVNSANHTDDIKIGIGYKKNAFGSDFRYNYNHTQNGIPLYTADEPNHYKFSGKYQDLTTNNFSLKNRFKVKQSHVKTNIGFSQVRRQLVKQAQASIDMQLRTVNADIKWYLPKMNRWEIIAGTQGMLQNNKNYGIHLLLPNAYIANAGIYTNINRSFETGAMQAGLRYDYHYIKTDSVDANRPGFSKQLSSITGALGFKKDLINDRMSLRLNIASGFRAPNLAELTSNGEHEGRIEIGNPDLKNEQNMQVDLNWDYHTTHIEFFVNGFYNQIYNYIYLSPVMQPMNMLPVYQYQQDDAYLYGGEAGLHFHPHPWDWLHVKSSFETVTGIKQDGTYLPLIPADQWKNEFRLINKHLHGSLQKYYWSFELQHFFKARTPAGNGEYPAYTLLNTNAGMHFAYKKMTGDIFIAVHNLTNKTYISNLSVLREKGIPNQGLNVILGLDLKF